MLVSTRMRDASTQENIAPPKGWMPQHSFGITPSMQKRCIHSLELDSTRVSRKLYSLALDLQGSEMPQAHE
ncbi:hypothetical protein V6N12_034558 [Hibiscus sabdariffa]|uniref:Uncharacterized protein n=1 Tax=Hibiscus sabdariffa TaxID=183260 RepID=A0ABR2DHI2_9ROSI